MRARANRSALDLDRGARGARRRRGAHRRGYSGRERRRPGRCSDEPMFADRHASSSTARWCSPSSANTRDAARRAARLAKVEVATGTPLRDRRRRARRRHRTILPDYAFAQGRRRRGAGRERRTASTASSASAARSISISKARSRSPSRARTATCWSTSSTQHPSEVQHLRRPRARRAARRRDGRGAPHGRRLRRQGDQAAQWAAIAALAARKTGRPCKIRLDRDDDMSLTGKRHDFRADYAVGFDDDGRIRALDVVLAARCGYSADLSGADQRPRHVPRRQRLLPAGARPSSPSAMKTNTVSNTAFRGFGGPQGMMAIERVIDDIAWTLGLDPLDVRKRNLYGDRPRRHALRHDGRGQHRCPS